MLLLVSELLLCNICSSVFLWMIFLLSICGILWFVHICLDRLDLYQNNASCNVQIFVQFSAPVVLYFEREALLFVCTTFVIERNRTQMDFWKENCFSRKVLF